MIGDPRPTKERAMISKEQVNHNFEELKKQAQNDLGSNFSLKEFHRYILEMGPVQFDILFSYLKQWENSLVVVSSRAA